MESRSHQSLWKFNSVRFKNMESVTNKDKVQNVYMFIYDI